MPLPGPRVAAAFHMACGIQWLIAGRFDYDTPNPPLPVVAGIATTDVALAGCLSLAWWGWRADQPRRSLRHTAAIFVLVGWLEPLTSVARAGRSILIFDAGGVRP